MSKRSSTIGRLVIGLALLVTGVVAQVAPCGTQNGEWQTYGGDLASCCQTAPRLVCAR